MSICPDIKYLFEPRSVAVIGASHNTDKIGFKIIRNIIEGGYKGEVYPINPKGGEILGRKAYASVEEVPSEVDMAVTTVPAKFVFEAVKGCSRKGVKFNVVISSGFSEVGNVEEERQIVAHAREHGQRILGPNIFGLYSAKSSLDTTFGTGGIVAGNVAIISQSGALGLAMIGKTAVENVGMSAMISVGNKADIDEADLLCYLMDQDETNAIMMYIEGVRDGERFVPILKQAARKKPVVVIKSGRSKRGAAAAASHTGSLAGSDEVFDDIVRQCGAIRAESVKEGFQLCKFLGHAPVPRGSRAVIVTNGGGIGVLATDACEKYEVGLHDDKETLERIFRHTMPDFGSAKNPIDLTGGADTNSYNLSLDAALKEPTIEAVIALYCETAVFDADNLTPMVKENFDKYQKAEKPIVFSAFGGEGVENAMKKLSRAGVPIYDDVYEAVNCLGGLYKYSNFAARPKNEVVEAEIAVGAIEKIIEKAKADGRSFLLAHEGQELLKAAGIGMPRTKIAGSADEAAGFAEEIGYPLVMKVVSRDILHKSDSGGVLLNLTSADQVRQGFQTITDNCLKAVPGAKIDGIEVTEMVRKGTELIVGARRDSGFGPIVMVGLGGIYVEVMKDVTFRAAPLSRREAEEMVHDIRAYKLLEGVRGEKRRDIPALTDSIIRLGTIIRRVTSITDIEINPVMLYEEGQGSKAVDIRVLFK